MIELLILFELSKKISTMYGILKSIHTDMYAFTAPGIGTIKPALQRLESSGYVKSRKSMSEGGRPSTFYSITDEGRKALKDYILSPVPDNPVHFLTNARIRLYCAEVLNDDELKVLIYRLKLKSASIMASACEQLGHHKDDFYPKIILDNLACEYKNFISLLEGVGRAGKR